MGIYVTEADSDPKKKNHHTPIGESVVVLSDQGALTMFDVVFTELAHGFVDGFLACQLKVAGSIFAANSTACKHLPILECDYSDHHIVQT